MTGAPGRTKCPVAPASAIALSTVIFILDVLNTVSEFSVGPGLFSNDESLVHIAVVLFSQEVLLMTTVLSSSSPPRLL